MKVIQCDRCKKIIIKGRIVQFEYKNFELRNKEEYQWYSKELEICDSCYNNLLIFLGDDTSK